MTAAIYVLGAITTLICAVLLLRGYRNGKKKLLLWSGLCFAGLTISNVILFVDLVMIPEVDLFRWRLVTAAVALLMLVYGLIWETK